jgi:hypothetical protein
MTESELRKAISWWWKIIIPSWTINISSYIWLPSNTKIIGSWKNSTIINFIWSNYNWEWIFYIKWKSNISIENLTINWNKKSLHWIWLIYGANNVLIKNVLIKNVGPSSKNSIYEAPYNASWINIYWWASNFTIENSNLISCSKHWISVWKWVNYLIKNNIITDCFCWIDVSTWTNKAEVLWNDISNTVFGTKIANAKNVYFHHNHFHDLDWSDRLWWRKKASDQWHVSKDWWTAIAYQMTNSNLWWNVEVAYNTKSWYVKINENNWNNAPINSHDNWK